MEQIYFCEKCSLKRNIVINEHEDVFTVINKIKTDHLCYSPNCDNPVEKIRVLNKQKQHQLVDYKFQDPLNTRMWGNIKSVNGRRFHYKTICMPLKAYNKVALEEHLLKQGYLSTSTIYWKDVVVCEFIMKEESEEIQERRLRLIKS